MRYAIDSSNLTFVLGDKSDGYSCLAWFEDRSDGTRVPWPVKQFRLQYGRESNATSQVTSDALYCILNFVQNYALVEVSSGARLLMLDPQRQFAVRKSARLERVEEEDS